MVSKNRLIINQHQIEPRDPSGQSHIIMNLHYIDYSTGETIKVLSLYYQSLVHNALVALPIPRTGEEILLEDSLYDIVGVMYLEDQDVVIKLIPSK